MEHIYFDSRKRKLILLDQRHLPAQELWLECANTRDVIYALQEMVVRGAPAIGVTAAYGCVLAALEMEGAPDWQQGLEQKLEDLSRARPTAVNLRWAVQRMQSSRKDKDFPTPGELARFWLDQAQEIHAQDIRTNRVIGRYGQELLQDGDTVMTHCNAGALATGGYGTALGVIRAAVEEGKQIRVVANETRPFLQGARLTAYELARDGIEVRVACDNACGLLMEKNMVQKIVVGADCIAANGDTANKIGTYTLAVLAARYGIPFYVAAPLSTFDSELSSGSEIPIEERDPSEVQYVGDKLITPPGVEVFNFAFDVTPHNLIAGIITEQGVFTPPLERDKG